MNAADKHQLYDYLKKAKGKGINKAYAHWTAGGYSQHFSDYHICVKGNPDGEVYFTTDNLAAILEHTWNRNTRAIGLAFCGCYDAKYPINNPKLVPTWAQLEAHLGSAPITPKQIEVGSETLAILCKELDIPIIKSNVMTHYEAAMLDGYGPFSGDPATKWDLQWLKDYDGQWKSGGDILRGKAIWYQQNL